MIKALFTDKNLIWGIAALLILFGLLFVLDTLVTHRLFDKEIFVITSGEGFGQIADQLAQQRLIPSATAFRSYGYLRGDYGKIKPGAYALSGQLSTIDIFKMLLDGPPVTRVTVTEGMSLNEIEKLLRDRAVITGKQSLSETNQDLKSQYQFLKDISSVDGFLFPDTYQFMLGSDPSTILKKFLENFSEKAWPLIEQKKNYYQILIMASLIEKEVPLPKDRFIVSGILWKRLQAGMKLQVDAAPETYEHYGLPLKPIDNPGLGAIEAALLPKATSFWYYLSDPKTSKTIFSETFDEHIDNKYRYLRK